VVSTSKDMFLIVFTINLLVLANQVVKKAQIWFHQELNKIARVKVMIELFAEIDIAPGFNSCDDKPLIRFHRLGDQICKTKACNGFNFIAGDGIVVKVLMVFELAFRRFSVAQVHKKDLRLRII